LTATVARDCLIRPMGEGPEQNPFAPPAEYADFPLRAVGYEDWHLATYWQRFAGAFIDNILYGLTIIPGLMVVGAAGDLFEPYARGWGAISILIGPLVLAVFQWTMTARTGQTLAKMMLRTRVVREGLGTPPGFVYGVLLRSWLFLLGGAVIGCLGFFDAVFIFFGNRNQTLHDRVAQTIVIRE
jgi:uncharacterized RDD family membrane protein YckC